MAHEHCEGVTNDNEFNKIGEYLIKTYKNAKEVGSLISVEGNDYVEFKEYIDNCNVSGQITMESNNWYSEVMPTMQKVAKQADIMARKYCVVSTNPPYMNKLEGELKKVVIEKYKAYSGDLFSVFMYRNFDYCTKNGYSAFMTPFVWMFIKTYEQLRTYIIEQKSIITLVQMEYSAFEEATVPICSFVLKNGKECKNGLYIKLSEFKGGMEVQRQKVIEALKDKSCNYFYLKNIEEFCFITGSPLSFWASKAAVNSFQDGKSLADMCSPKVGLQTGDVDLFVRKWFECSTENLCLNNVIMKEKSVWFPYNNGGEFRKWYGNNDEVVNWKDDGIYVINHINKAGKKGARPQNRDYYFRNGATWSAISSSSFSVRLFPEGFLFSNAGMAIFAERAVLYYIVGFLNSKLAQKYLGFFNEGLNYNQGDISKLPIILSEKYISDTIDLVANSEVISKMDWNAFESSWEFTKHPFIDSSNLKNAFEKWKRECENRFCQLKKNEEEINRIFIDIYGLQNELGPEVEDKDITIYQADLQKDIKSFISYAVGCMFGRYSLNVEGLIYAGGEWDDGKYGDFVPDKDNVIPISDEEYFEDDILGLFVEFVKMVYGKETLEDNLAFIASALGNKGNTSREIIRNYFLKDFYKDHLKTYQKRPIYWLYDSGKNDGFKALVYMHRYTEDTTGIVRVDYLHKMQKIYMNEIERMQEMVDNSSNSKEVAQAEKRKEKLVKQLKETKEYDEKIAHLALSRIDIDLDDGVKVNYEKVQTGQDGKKLDILGKI